MTRIGMALDPRGRHVVARRRRRGRLVAELLIAVVATAQLATAGWIITQRSVSTVVDVDDLLAEVRVDPAEGEGHAATATEGPASSSVTGSGGSTADDGGGTPLTADVTTAEAPDTRAGPGDPASGGVGADDAEAGRAPDQATNPAAGAGSEGPAASAAFVRPTEGVYAYRSEGYESISLGGARHDYPGETFAIVDHEDGCGWSFDHRVLEEKRTVSTYCTDGARLSVLAYDGYVTFYGSTTESHYTCDGGTRADVRDDVGASHVGTCRDEESTTTDTVTFVGRESLDVGGQTIETLHYHIDTAIEGSIEGTSTQEVWVRPEDALLVRLERDTRTSGEGFGAEVDYEEHAVFHLASLTPRS